MEIINNEVPEEIRALFSFNNNTPEEEVLLKFNLYVRFFFPNFFKSKDAPFHKEIDKWNCRVYSEDIKYFVNIVFRGGAKTTRTKLFVAFAIANDDDHFRKYFKILTKDIKNSKQFVTDVYNLLINKRHNSFYPELFEKTVEKRAETMGDFTTATGIKIQAGTVGVDQRGNIQEDARPDFIVFDDFETRNTLRSAVESNTIWSNMEEARTGLSKNGGAVYTCNYLSERGNVHKLVTKKQDNKHVLIVPIIKDNIPAWDIYTVDEIARIKQDSDDFAGEYLCEPSIGADVFFERESLLEMKKRDPIKTIGGFKIFFPYNPSHRYGLGADVSGGVELDSSTSVTIDFSVRPNRVVAVFESNQIKPMDFGDEIAFQGEYFGECIVAPEKNNHGHATIGRLKQIYGNIYETEKKQTVTHDGLPKEYGWHTNAMTKPQMLQDLRKAVSEGYLELTDENIINEAISYSRNDLMDKDIDPRLTTRHFDLLIALAIAWQMRHHATRETREMTMVDYGLTQQDFDIYE